jgi:DNA repair exonuclease SbcCD ATPase subunit
MTKGEENIVLNERDELIQTIEAQQQMIFEANKQIQAQQQEISQLKGEMWDKDAEIKILCERIQALTADKDEQAGRLMKMDYLLRRTLPILEVANDQQELIEQINELLGGKEDA